MTKQGEPAAGKEMESQEILEKLLLNYRDYYGAYHHHKERMAYAATVLYLSAASAAILLSFQKIKERAFDDR